MADGGKGVVGPRAPGSRRRRLTAGLVALAVAAAGGVAADVWWPRPAGAAIGQVEMTVTDGTSYLTVSQTLTQMRLELTGASGEAGQDGVFLARGGAGGHGGRLTATLVMGHGIRVGDLLALYAGVRGDKSQGSNPLAGGPGGSETPYEGGYGGGGGGGSGVYDQTSGRWLLVAGGGGGGSGPGSFELKGVDGGAAGAPGSSSTNGGGGTVGANCPEQGADMSALEGGSGASSSTGRTNGGGGGGGGGCYGGGGGAAGGPGAAGGGGAGGRTWNFAQARDVTVATAPAGDGSIHVTLEYYNEPKPAIVSPDRFDLTVGQAAVDDVVSVGKPPPELHVSGHFPAGLTFRIPLWSGKGEIRGTPEPGSEGTYPITVTARNDWGAVEQTVVLVVHPPPSG